MTRTIDDVTAAKASADSQLVDAKAALEKLIPEQDKAKALELKNGAVAAAAEAWRQFAAAFSAAYTDVNTSEARDVAESARGVVTQVEGLARQAIQLYATKFA